MINFLREAARVKPSQKQLDWFELEFYAFIHFGPNTFTDREWGDGTEREAVFNPQKLDCDQWVEAIKSAGMKGMVLTAKHHDGFCLWPSAYTEHSVKNSPCKKDVVWEAAQACKRGGIKFGFYLSPWDRNSRYYGTPAYNDYFCNQLTELLTQYGDIFYVWFDNACGEGPNGKKQEYDFPRYFDLIHKYQPQAVIFNDFGPDVRWCGNEAGQTRPAEWSVVPARLRDTEKVASESQQEDDDSFRQKTLNTMDLDLGSREIVAKEKDLIWYPAEVDTSIRPGWFYHASEDDKVRSLEELLHIYENSVGGNAMLLLNIPPTREGLIHENDVKRLREIGEYRKKAFSQNLLTEAVLEAEPGENGHGIEGVREDNYETFYKPADGVREVRITVRFPAETAVSFVVLKENIKLSQRIERFEIRDGKDNVLYEGTTVGYQKIARLKESVKADELRICILDSRVCPTLAFVGVY